MVNRESRDALADALHGFLAGHTSNDEFDDWLFENRFDYARDPADYSDPALGPLIENAWCLYSDTREYRLIGRNRLDNARRREVLRWVLFLRSDAEYEWPPIRFVNPALLSLSGFVSSVASTFAAVLTLGLWRPDKAAVLSAREALTAWQASGHHDLWPFLRREDYERERHRYCPLAVTGPAEPAAAADRLGR